MPFLLKNHALLLAALLLLAAPEFSAEAADRPNVVLIMTDDQGYGDLGIHGNPFIRTPNIDGTAKKSAVLTNFFVSPVCTPTRASLMTGRYNYRTRAIDTFRGRVMMDTSEMTIAELLKAGGYATGIFGKWHLGDCHPMRPMDQGFHRGGGIGQPSDPPGAEDKYTDPVLFRYGQAEAPCSRAKTGAGAAWGPTDEGHWLIEVATRAPLDVKLIVFPADTDRTIHFRCGSLETSATLPAKATEHIFPAQKLPAGDQKLEAWIEANNRPLGVRFVELSQ